MLNGRVILLGGLCVLFIVAATFGQEPSDPNIIPVTQKIDVAKLNENVENLTKSVDALTKTVEKLGTTVETLNTTVGELKITVARIDERTQGIAKTQNWILVSIIVPLVVAILYYIFTQKMNRESKSDTASTQAVRGNQSEAASSNPAQVNQDEVSSTPTLPSGFPEREAVKEYLKSYSPTTKETV